MLNNGQIYKINTKNKLLDIREAFQLGKILFQFRSYDMTKPQGQRCFDPVDFYLSLEDMDYLSRMMINGGLERIALENAKKSSYPEPAFKRLGGTKAGISRQFIIDGPKEGGKLFIKVFQGKGKTDGTGKIIPAYKFNDPDVIKYIIPLKTEDVKILGLAIQRAINFYDQANILGILDERLKDLSFRKADVPLGAAPYIPEEYISM